MDLTEWKELTRRASGAAARGRPKEARQLLQIALSFAERTRNPIVLGVTLNNLGVLASQNGHFEVAHNLYERARTLPIAAGEPTGLMACLSTNSGVNEHRQGQMIEARPLYQEAVRDTYAPHRCADPWAASLVNFAHLQLELGKLPQAESLVKRARQSLEKLPSRDRHLDSHVKYASALVSLAAGRLLKAETDFSELIAVKGGDPTVTALAQVGLAKVHLQQFQKIAELDGPEVAVQKLKWANALLSEALALLLQLRGALSLEYLEAALIYVEHLCASSQWREAELWAQRLRPWAEGLGRGVHPWLFRLLEHQERIFRQQKKITEAEEVAKFVVDLRFWAKSGAQADEREEGDGQ